ncbi:MerR family transcriptional regulator [Nonomuraea gerenzanensis]|uniref:Regulatory protein, MerR n=1 Tax=Nonomuraea gerenzanensis TaxID=93944 RepID=A0A1M4EIV9_9ACTN|nr:MerR family transcriptional regulator [Nonomuraea gerenzanensis]UBU10356.1 MerR family transcriptional regulator [Nonomuraea gerenzanensis]SBO98746.1 regulatory protein, MerR [Nonomuraea gerenzanensis]
MTDGVTIGQAAAFADVTVKAIRHYHRHRLIDEPARDSSGYRRYESADLLRLVQIRTLAGAGVPLAEIGAILDADPDRFATALLDAERRLTDRIDDLIARRETLRRLATGDRALLPDRALALLDRAADLGLTPADVTMAREGLVLIKALVPEGFDDYISRIERALDDPRYMSLIERMWCAAEWEANDPRIDELATAIADHFLAHPALLPIPAGLQDRTDSASRYSLLTHHGHEQKPGWTRLTALIEARLRSAGIDIADQTPLH